jgi:predicted RNase H-like HicB family nuclease
MGEKNMKWRVVLESDSETGDWAVWCPELPGCVSAGETEEEALENIKEAITLYLEPNPIKLKSGAVLREVSVDGNNMNMLNIWCV